MNEERPIEKLLRRYAQKRRDEASVPDLHPATRRLLQGEVARQYSRGAGGEKVSFGQILRSWLPWLVGVTAVVIMIAGGTIMLFTGSKQNMAMAPTGETSPAPMELAKADPEAAAKEATTRNETPAPRVEQLPAPAVAVAPAGADARGDSSVHDVTKKSVVSEFGQPNPGPVRRPPADLSSGAKTESDAKKLLVAQPPAPMPAAPRVEASSLAKDKNISGALITNTVLAEKKADDENRRARAIAAAPAGAGRPAPAAETYSPQKVGARGGGFEGQKSYSRVQDFAEAQTQRYSNVAPATPVLKNFQVSQAGNEWRVIDDDGSVYSGNMVRSAGGGGGPTGRGQPAAPVTTGSLSMRAATPNYYYRVVGTNRTLNQLVIFSWNFAETTNAADRLKTGFADTATVPNTPLSGRVQVGNNREIELNAAPDAAVNRQSDPATLKKALNQK